MDTSLPLLAATGSIFVLAGMVKGVIGLGLPTISMGLLGLLMSPVEAAALLVVPSLVTNLWQMAAGPRLAALTLRLWPMMAGICLGIWAGAALLGGLAAAGATQALGVALMVYAAVGLAQVRMAVAPAWERWLGPAAGAVTGILTGATGVFVIPAVPYLQALGLGKDDLVQALGLSFTVSTLALAASLAAMGALGGQALAGSLLTLAPACLGMAVGQWLRRGVQPALFRRCFFGGVLVLGAHLALSGLL